MIRTPDSEERSRFSLLPSLNLAAASGLRGAGSSFAVRERPPSRGRPMAALLLLALGPAVQAAWPDCQWSETILRGAGKSANALMYTVESVKRRGWIYILSSV